MASNSKNHATAHTPPRAHRDKASKNEEEKKQNPGGLKMHNEGRGRRRSLVGFGGVRRRRRATVLAIMLA